jgi:hypothetical protein
VAGAHTLAKTRNILYMFNPFKFINIPVFIITLALGIMAVYVTTSPLRKIIVYPTPDNIDKLLYKDRTDACFKYEQEKVTCPANKDEVYQIPVQN